MKLVPAKCPNCGGTLQVDSEKDAVICEYCKTAFVVQKAIENYNQTIQSQTINNNGTINVENVNIYNSDSVAIKNAYSLGMQAMNGNNFTEAIKYFTIVLEKDFENANAILYRGIASAFLSKLAVNFCQLRLSEMDAAFDTVFKNKRIYSRLSQNDINQAYYHAIMLIDVIAKKALEFYQPGYRYMDNINMVWTVLERCFNSLTVIGCYIPVALPNENDETQLEIMRTIARLTSGILSQLLVERSYSVDWGARSGLGQINKVKHPQFAKYDQLKREFDEKMQKELNGFTPQNVTVSNSSEGGCYVATCVYGSYDCPQVWTLRRYRDYYLDEKWWGRLFIKIYYRVSPTIVMLFGKTKWFNRINRFILDKKIKKLEEKGYKNTAYTDKY